jgi:hypothetical protein
MLKIHVHEGLLERVIVRQEFSGLEPDEAEPYIKAMLKAAFATSPILAPDAVTAIFEAAREKPRLMNAPAGKCLLLGYVREARAMDSKIVQEAPWTPCRSRSGPDACRTQIRSAPGPAGPGGSVYCGRRGQTNVTNGPLCFPMVTVFWSKSSCILTKLGTPSENRLTGVYQAL